MVKLGTHCDTGQKVAVKIIPRDSSPAGKNNSVNNKIEREIAIMKLIEHPNILSLHDVYENDGELYLIMELVEGGELFDYLIQKGRLKEPEALKFFHHIVSGLDYCHKHYICHRDLKPENLLLDGDMNIKIADFGMASLQRTGKLLETSCGSPHYASPEIIKGIKYDGAMSDVWSCGVILFALLTGSLPFDDKNVRKLLTKVKQGQYNIPPYVPEGARDLINSMLNVDPAKRMTLQEVQEHPWFNLREYHPHEHIAPNDSPLTNKAAIDPDIIESLGYLGWGQNAAEAKQLTEDLLSSEKNQQKVFYHLLAKRKQMQYISLESPDVPMSPMPPSSPRRRQSSYGSMFLDTRSHSAVSVEGSEGSVSPVPPNIGTYQEQTDGEMRSKAKSDGSRWAVFTPNDPNLQTPIPVRPAANPEERKKLTIATEKSNPLLHAAVMGAASSPKGSHRGSATQLALPSPTFINSQKKSWFANLFNFKPESMCIYAAGNADHISTRTVEILDELNIARQDSSRDARQYKCRYDEVNPYSHDSTQAAQSVKFRISLESCNTSELPHPAAVSDEPLWKIVLMQQQGTALLFEKVSQLFLNKWNEMGGGS